MATDSDQTSKLLDDMGKAARRDAQKRDERWQTPPEAAAVRQQRELNDSYGRHFSPWKK